MIRRWLKKNIFEKRDSSEIAPEEIFMDSLNMPGFRSEMHEGRIERPISRLSLLAFGAVALLGFIAAAARLAELQIVKGRVFFEQAKANKTYPVAIASPRGIFYDRNFEMLVENAPLFEIWFNASAIQSDDEFAEIFSRLAALTAKSFAEIADGNGLSTPLSEVQARLNRSFWPQSILIAVGDLRPEVIEIQSRPEDFRAVTVTEAARRNYVFGPSTSHVLGYVGRPSREDLSSRAGVRFSDVIGKSGLEFQYDDFLRGRPGEKLIEVNAKGEAMRERFIVKAASGQDLQLEIDGGLQRFAAETLERHLKALGKKAGAVLALDPRDGALRAMVSFPGYDPNLFGRSGSGKNLRRLLDDPGKPFFNRVVSGGYPSGSTIKPILAVAALEEGIIDPRREIYDPGYISVPNPYDPSNPTIFKDWKALGYVDMRRAIAFSANVYFYTIGGGYGGQKGLGIERIKKYLELFGWGAPLGIDLPGEYAGLIPDPEKKKSIRPKDPVWRLGDTYISSIGQGDMQTTPLQLAGSIAAIANGGTLWKPRLAKAVVDGDRRAVKEFFPEAVRTGLAKAESLSVVGEGMRQAVTDGSARALSDLFFSVAGKTGTAQTGVYGKNHGWFAGFAPYDSPEIVIVVLVEEGAGGSTDAVPIAKEILYYYFTQARNTQLTSGR